MKLLLVLLGVLAAAQAKCPSTSGLTEICYDDLFPFGCYTTDPPYGNTPERPFAQLPTCTENVNANFHLDTRQQKGYTFAFNDDLNSLLSQPGFDRNHKTRFIVHGYLDNGNDQWMVDISNQLLEAEDCNVIRVGWFGASAQINYISSACDTQTVGSELAIIATNMMNNLNMNARDMHCIGHSLGSHICGYMGKHIANIGRITGLDPAGPYFDGTPNEVKLDSTDAQFVDIIHTDAENLSDLGYGTSEATGHIDYWPNNGMEQPGCDQNIVTSVGDNEFVACNHLRAYLFFQESIGVKKCKFLSYQCSNYGTFLNGECLSCGGAFSNCAEMGFYADSSTDSNGITNVYLQTHIEDPFCIYMTDIQINFGPATDGVKALLYISLYGSDGSASDQEKMFEGDVVEVRASTSMSSLVNFNLYPNTNVNYIKFLWTQEEFTVGSNTVQISSIDLYSAAEDKWFQFCLSDPTSNLEESIRYTMNQC